MLRPVFIDLQGGFAYCRQQVGIALQAVKMWFMERLPVNPEHKKLAEAIKNAV